MSVRPIIVRNSNIQIIIPQSLTRINKVSTAITINLESRLGNICKSQSQLHSLSSSNKFVFNTRISNLIISQRSKRIRKISNVTTPYYPSYACRKNICCFRGHELPQRPVALDCNMSRKGSGFANASCLDKRAQDSSLHFLDNSQRETIVQPN